MNFPLDRRTFIAGLGGATAVSLMSHEARADALEGALLAQTTPARVAQRPRPPSPQPGAREVFPTAAQVEAQIPTRPYRRGAGGLFYNSQAGNVALLPKMPAAPTLIDFFALRFDHTRNHCLQSANKALQRGVDEEIVLACLLHDTVQELMRADHGYWSAQMYEPYISERTAFAIRYHQALRFFADSKAGYEYPDLYKRLYGEDYVPDAHVQARLRLRAQASLV